MRGFVFKNGYENVVSGMLVILHDDAIKWPHWWPAMTSDDQHYWPFVRGIHRSPVNFPHKGQWCGALMFSLICAWINGWVNNREAGDLRRHRAHYDVIVMCWGLNVLNTLHLVPSLERWVTHSRGTKNHKPPLILSTTVNYNVWMPLIYSNFLYNNARIQQRSDALFMATVMLIN